jgi:hypothetical protein
MRSAYSKGLMKKSFFIRKMRTEHAETVKYSLDEIHLNTFLGKNISLRFTGKIQCVNCSREIKKTFFDGHCFPCFQKLARCDMCILKPELCHFQAGTCREPEWGKENCLIKHVVYLSNTSGLKVGITREHKRFERWIDQGALESVVLAEVPDRLTSGKLEVLLAKEVGDKTDWRALILGKRATVDLIEEREKLKKTISDEFSLFLVDTEIQKEVHKFNYPILKYPEKVKPHNFDKEQLLEGNLNGIRGQYIFINEKAINIRKYSGYEIEFQGNLS